MLDPSYRPALRHRFIEFHEQSYTPTWIRKPVQQLLTIAWTVCFYPLQEISPSELSVEVLEEVVSQLEIPSLETPTALQDTRQAPVQGLRKRKALEGRSAGFGTEDESDPPLMVDFCSGAGGPLPTIERVMNEHRLRSNRSPIPFLLTDLYPATSHWELLARASPTGSLKFVAEQVDATKAARATIESAIDAGRQSHLDGEGTLAKSRAKQFRTFFLAFHHFDEDSALRVLEDAMQPLDVSGGNGDGGGSDGVGIFELQMFNLGSLATITMLWPMSLVMTPFLSPSFAQLVFTYLIPIIPFILVFDGYISAYRSRSPEHIEYLGAKALENIRARNVAAGRSDVQVDEWEWKSGVRRHTWPAGRMYWTVGTRKTAGKSPR